MFLGIEIGGTKLQLGVGRGDGNPLVALERHTIDPTATATEILDRLEVSASKLITRHPIEAIGIGFGGPVDPSTGRVITSHQIEGWDGFELGRWFQQRLGLPTHVCNDCDAAALAEARFGAGREERIVFYVTVGSGIGGGLVIGGQIHRGNGPSVAEIGHLRPGLHADHAEATVESLASGWGLAAAAQARIADPASQELIPLEARRNARRPDALRKRLIGREDVEEEYAADLRQRCHDQPEQLTAKLLAVAASEGNELAREVLAHGCQVLGWAIAQMITLVSPGMVIVGGGVSLMEQSLFLVPLRREVERYVFPPLLGSYQIVPAQLGEEVVVHGALAIAAQASHND